MTFSKMKNSDVPELAVHHVQSWKETYQGIIPDEYLNGLTVESRVNLWTKVLENKDHYGEIVRAEGKIIAFISAGRFRGDGDLSKNEIFAIYISKAYQRRNLGRELCARYFTATENSNAYVWVLKDNPACAFYEKLGGRNVGEADVEMGGQVFKELLYIIEHP